MIAGLTLTKIVIIQSLEPHEFKTGKNLSEFIEAEVSEYNLKIPVELINCENRLEFLEILGRLSTEAKTTGEKPLVHVECHGSIQEGLEFENGSTLTWPEVASALLELNLACRFNLFAAFSACFGGHFLSQMEAVQPSPCWCIVAPTEKVDPGELLSGFRTFYSTFLQHTDVGVAVAELRKTRLSTGHWFGQVAELWFEQVVISYIERHCTVEAARVRAKKLYRKLKRTGITKSIGNIMRTSRQHHIEGLLEKYFAIYFSTAEIPENIQRFEAARARLDLKLRKLRDTNKYNL